MAERPLGGGPRRTRRAGACVSRWALAATVHALLLAQVTDADAAPAPLNTQDCPECAFGAFRCNRKCSANEISSTRTFQFGYRVGPCWEEYSTGKSVQEDTDVWCQLPEAKSLLDCSNMKNSGFVGIGKLGNECSPQSEAASALVSERCEWICKAGRPFARCRWLFDESGTIFPGDAGTLKRCDLLVSCENQGAAEEKVRVSAACQPTGLWMENQKAHLDLAESRNQQRLAEMLVEHAVTMFGNGTRQYAEAMVRAQNSETELASARTELAAADGTAKELRDLQVAHQQTLLQLSEASASVQELQPFRSAFDEMQQRAVLAEAALRAGLAGPIDPNDPNQVSMAVAFSNELLREEAKREELRGQLDGANQTSVGLGVAMALVTCVCCGFVALLFAYRRKFAGELDEATLSDLPGVLVVGRPVDGKRDPPLKPYRGFAGPQTFGGAAADGERSRFGAPGGSQSPPASMSPPAGPSPRVSERQGAASPPVGPSQSVSERQGAASPPAASSPWVSERQGPQGASAAAAPLPEGEPRNGSKASISSQSSGPAVHV